MYFDLEHTVRTDGGFKSKLLSMVAKLEDYSQKSEQSSKYSALSNDLILEILRFCKFNPTFLLPYYFPAYPKNDPMTLRHFPYAYHLMPIHIGGYLCIRGSRQIAKSTTIAARQRLNAHILPKFRSLYIAPKTEQVKTYANRFRELEYAFKCYQSNYKYRQNLYLKEYPNGSMVEFFNVDTQVTNIRGKSSDELIFDEFQNFDPEFEPEISEVQSASETPVTVYAGTSLTTDTALEAKYAASSQGVWVMKCEACNHENIPLPEHNVMDMIMPEGVSCSKCEKLIDVTKGRFIHLEKVNFNEGKIGLHIPQIIVPFVVNNKLRYSEIYRKKLEQDPRKFFQENLGIPTEEGERELTEKDLQNICTLGTNVKALQEKAAHRKYKFIVSGCDWGGSDYDLSLKTKLSYTVHVVLGVTLTGKYEIVHMKRYEGMNYTDIAGDIMYNHNRLKADAMGSDWGVGYAYNMLIREQMAPEKHLIFKYSSPNAEPLKETQTMFNMYSLNRTESLTVLYDGIRTNRICCYDWDLAKPYLKDFMNLYRIPDETPGGVNQFKYRKHGAKSDDVIHAINFAFTVGRIYNQEPLVPDRALIRKISESLDPGLVEMRQGDDGGIQGFSM
jgi:hypothetical protein